MPEDIASACLFLASEQASWMTGANIKVHGGGEKPAYLDASTGQVTQTESQAGNQGNNQASG